MAISFTKTLPTTELLASHNNNIVKFSSDNVLTPVSCLVTVDGIPTPIAPNPSGEFEFNFIELVKSIVNQNKFKDEITPTFPAYIYKDKTLYKAITAVFKISFTGGTTEEVSRTYHFIKSVRQSRKYENQEQILTELQLLLPYDLGSNNSNKTHYAVYNNGFPFDVPLFSYVARTITMKNVTNGSSESLDLIAGVNRIFFSQGDKSMTNENYFPLTWGMNEIEFQVSATERVTLFIEKRESECSPFLKFYNNSGGYSYIKLNKRHYEDLTTKTIASIESNLSDVSDTSEEEYIVGKESTVRKTFVLRVNKRQLNYYKDILSSPRVDLYQELIYQKQDIDSFYGVKLIDGTFRLVSGLKNTYELKLVVEYKLNTLTL